jgi:hypothetical protein
MVEDPGLKPFEEQTLTLARETLSLAKKSYWISFVGLGAAIAAAAFVLTQVRIMSYQTGVMYAQIQSSAAEDAINDLNVRSELKTAQQEAQAAQLAAGSSTQQVELSQRPWISVDSVTVPPNESLIVGKNLIMTTIAVDLTNIGHSPATNVAVRVQLIGAETGSFPDEVKGVCEDAEQDTNLPFGETIFQDKKGSPISYPTRLSPKEVVRYWAQGGGVFSVVGCAAYRSSVSKRHYYTGFIYDIFLKQYPTAPAQIPGNAVILQNALSGFITQ